MLPSVSNNPWPPSETDARRPNIGWPPNSLRRTCRATVPDSACPPSRKIGCLPEHAALVSYNPNFICTVGQISGSLDAGLTLGDNDGRTITFDVRPCSHLEIERRLSTELRVAPWSVSLPAFYRRRASAPFPLDGDRFTGRVRCRRRDRAIRLSLVTRRTTNRASSTSVLR